MIIVVGAGIAGLSLAYELCQRGSQVTVLEADTIASGASGVATSYLEPRLGTTPARAIEHEAMRRWEDYTADLEAVSGFSVGFRREGQIRVTLAENLVKFEKDLDARAAQNEVFEHLSAEAARKLEPALSNAIVAAAYLPHVRWVTGSKVCESLATAIRSQGGKIEERVAVTAIERQGSQLRLTTDTGSFLDAERIVLCTGMGVQDISGLPEDIPQSRPVRGVNLILDQSALKSPLKHLVKHHRGNLCPREDNQLIVGTTYEAGETSLEPGPDVIEFLYRNAEPILPVVRDLLLIRVTSGLRSKVGDGNLRLGRSTEEPNIFYSLSHAGAGYLRAPVVADEFAGFVLGGEPGALTRHITDGRAD